MSPVARDDNIGINDSINLTRKLKQIQGYVGCAINVTYIVIKAAMILQLLVNETYQFNTRGKKSEPTDVKSTTKLDFSFTYIDIFIYFTNKRYFRFIFFYILSICKLV